LLWIIYLLNFTYLHMLHEYHVIYSVQYYPWFHITFHITPVGLRMYYLWIPGGGGGTTECLTVILPHEEHAQFFQ
jgi:hypothetical protein